MGNKDYTSDFKVSVDSVVGSKTSVQPDDVKVNPDKQKIIDDINKIKNKTFVNTMMESNKILISGALVGAGLGFFLSFKFGKPILASSLIGGVLGLGATKIYTTFK